MKPLFLYILLFAFAGFAQQQPTKVTYAKSVNSFVPKGWKIITTTKGDLNKDGTEDVALVIEDTKKESFITKDTLTLNINPRTLLVLFKRKSDGFYSLATKHTTIIPAANEVKNPNLADPLLNDGGVFITKGNLHVDFDYRLTNRSNDVSSSFDVSNTAYIFRFQDNGFVLVGYDTLKYNEFSGDMSNTKTDFLTRKKVATTGDNIIGDLITNKKTVTENIKIDKLLTLTDITSDSEIDF